MKSRHRKELTSLENQVDRDHAQQLEQMREKVAGDARKELDDIQRNLVASLKEDGELSIFNFTRIILNFQGCCGLIMSSSLWRCFFVVFLHCQNLFELRARCGNFYFKFKGISFRFHFFSIQLKKSNLSYPIPSQMNHFGIFSLSLEI